eukprot:g19020.t1
MAEALRTVSEHAGAWMEGAAEAVLRRLELEGLFVLRASARAGEGGRMVENEWLAPTQSGGGGRGGGGWQYARASGENGEAGNSIDGVVAGEALVALVEGREAADPKTHLMEAGEGWETDWFFEYWLRKKKGGGLGEEQRIEDAGRVRGNALVPAILRDDVRQETFFAGGAEVAIKAISAARREDKTGTCQGMERDVGRRRDEEDWRACSQ